MGDRRSWVGACALVLLVMLSRLPHAWSAQPEAGSLSVTFVGDVMLDGGPGHAVGCGEDPFAHVASALNADFAVCNLECVVARRGKQVLKPYTFKARPECIPALKKYFSAVCVANNHSGDFGPESLSEELHLLKNAGLPYFGGGHDRAQAHRPAILQCRGQTIALLGYNDYPPAGFEAGDERAGCAWLREAEVVADIRAARHQHRADYVVPVLHWGEELEGAPTPEQRELARRLIEAGADAIVGMHPHVIQPIEIYKGRPILYSLGNFIFDYFPGDPPIWQGWIARLTFRKSGPTDVALRTVELDRTGFPHLKLANP